VREHAARLVLLALIVGCVQGIDESVPEPAVDEAYFRCKVQPVLVKSCAAFICHGDGARYFRMFARNRLRLGGTEAERNGLFRDTEYRHNFAAARAFVDASEPENSLLLLKPLEQRAGGFFHGGATEFGKGDVYLSRDEADNKILLNWDNGQTEDPACEEPGKNL
jgi:hypothetical protein